MEISGGQYCVGNYYLPIPRQISNTIIYRFTVVFFFLYVCVHFWKVNGFSTLWMISDSELDAFGEILVCLFKIFILLLMIMKNRQSTIKKQKNEKIDGTRHFDKMNFNFSLYSMVIIIEP